MVNKENKVLLFTHKVDIDGMGSAILASLIFENLEVVFCETFEMDQLFLNYVDDGSIYNYDQIFITDICLSESSLILVSNDDVLKSKIKIFDHHKLQIKNINDYEFLTLKSSDAVGLCCGTSLFYEYLLDNRLIENFSVVDDFVELTRQYDTWEWKDVYHNESANDLNLLFFILGREKYIEVMINKLITLDNFSFSSDEAKLIIAYKTEIREMCMKYISAMKIKKLDGLFVGVVKGIEYRCRNDLSQLIKDEQINIDYLVFDILNKDTVSFRSINPLIDVAEIATKFGGKGHKNASSCPNTNEVIKFYFD